MTDPEIAAKLDVIEAALKAIRDLLQVRASKTQVHDLPDDLMKPGDVIYEFAIPRSTLHRFCRANPISNADGFAFFDPAKQRHLISRSRFTAFLRRHGTFWDEKEPQRDVGGTSGA